MAERRLSMSEVGGSIPSSSICLPPPKGTEHMEGCLLHRMRTRVGAKHATRAREGRRCSAPAPPEHLFSAPVRPWGATRPPYAEQRGGPAACRFDVPAPAPAGPVPPPLHHTQHPPTLHCCRHGRVAASVGAVTVPPHTNVVGSAGACLICQIGVQKAQGNPLPWQGSHTDPQSQTSLGLLGTQGPGLLLGQVRGVAGIEPTTSRTLSENHATRPNSRSNI
jgi:hypothetical protein